MDHQNSETSFIHNLTTFSEELVSVNQSDRLFDCIIDGIMKIIGCNQASLMLFDSQKQRLQLIKVRGFKTQSYKSPRIELTADVARSIYEGGEVLAPGEQGTHKFLIIFDEDERKYFDCELRIPFFIREQLIGVLNLGKKSIGTDYSTDDITFLRILVNIAAISVENSLVLKRISSAPQQSDFRDLNSRLSKNFQIKRRNAVDKIIGQSDAIKNIQNLIEKVACSDVSVLVTGESGTGKELVAKEIHQRSCRRERSLVALNCAALPENLVESELFGHERGAFTGAHIRKKGKFEIANGATLFLDEIGDMSLSTQAKVLRVLEEKTFQRIGGHRNLEVDVRIIVATHKDLAEEIQKGTFREDLYYRINVMQIHIPPLRERKEDIPVLAEYFFKKYCQLYGSQIRKIKDDAFAKLMLYDFPGNVRELQNIIEKALILEQSDQLTLDFLPFSPIQTGKYLTYNSNCTLENLERNYIKKVIEQVNYNKSQAARILGIARKTLREKMQKYGI